MAKVDWERELTEEEKQFKAMLVESLPKIVCRTEVGKLTGNWLMPGTIKNDDNAGNGPRKRYESNKGKKIIYERESLVEYGIRRFGIVGVKSLAA